MNALATLAEPLPPSPSLETCDAVLIALASRRFVIVRRDGKIPLWSAERLCRPIRELRRGECVYYKGNRDTVEALAVY